MTLEEGRYGRNEEIIFRSVSEEIPQDIPLNMPSR